MQKRGEKDNSSFLSYKIALKNVENFDMEEKWYMVHEWWKSIYEWWQSILLSLFIRKDRLSPMCLVPESIVGCDVW